MKLYGIYYVVSNKKVRKNEKFYKRYPHHKSVPGTLVQTNRGFFIDGKNVDQKSVDLYLQMIENAKNGVYVK